MSQPISAAPRIEPLAPPYAPELDALLARMTPPGAPSILALFRVLAHNPELATRSTGWGGYLLGRKASLTLRDREVVINRVCARCGAQYEWGVHVAAFGDAAGFSAGAERRHRRSRRGRRRSRPNATACWCGWPTNCTTRPR